MADPIGWIAEGKPAENEAFMVFGKRTEYACVPVCRMDGVVVGSQEAEVRDCWVVEVSNG